MDKTTVIEVPVLIIGFNRPEILRQCISKLRESKPQSMYFACDGPRTDKKDEPLLVSEVQHIMKNEIDWECNRHYKFNDTNKGCEVTESEAITWVLDENEYIIVIEDDIIAPYSFLKFAQDMLYKYKDNEKIYQVTSDNYTPIDYPGQEDYCFSLYGHIWGWATWKRAWNHFDLYLNDFEVTKKRISKRNDLTDKEKKHLRKLCTDLQHEEKYGKKSPRHTWDIIWSYVKWRDNGLTIVPRVHLSSNVGIEGLHTKSANENHFRKYDDEFQVKYEPERVERNLIYDNYHYETYIKEPPFIIRQERRAVNYIKRHICEIIRTVR